MDCSYCPPHRHNTSSPHSDLKGLLKVASLPIQVSQTLRELSNKPISTQVNFTGGEPTTNPHLLSLCQFLKEADENLGLSITTNGLFSSKFLEDITQYVHYLTVSLHFEASEKTKKHVLENIYRIKELTTSSTSLLGDFHINMMVHANDVYFAEAVELSSQFKKDNIPFSLRAIGEHPNDKGAHLYDKQQIGFIKTGKLEDEPTNEEEPVKNKEGKKAGRPCCGNRSFKVIREESFTSGTACSALNSIEDLPDAGRVSERNFKDWACLVHLFFMHIYQEKEQVFHHQTCKAKLDGTTGPIGNFEDIDKIVEFYRQILETRNVPYIRCPNKICNCGLCITKAKNPEVLDLFLKQNFKNASLIRNHN